MLIKETEYKVNFIDKNDNFVGVDTRQKCCENFGWYITNCITEQKPESNLDSEGYWFDVKEEPVLTGDEEHVFITVFKLVNSESRALYLHLYNQHDGSYSHGWETSFGCDGYI